MIDRDSTTNNFPIQVFVSYEWGKDEQKNVIVRSDPRWKSLRAILQLVADEVMTRAKGYEVGDKVLDIRINRLRGRHGQFILRSLQQRIERGDILIMDIGSSDGKGVNSNVLIELGIALGLDKMASEGLFIFKPEAADLPSDLRGILITDYKLLDGQIQIVDEEGLRAALRTTLVNLAAVRGMLGPKKKQGVEIEDENPQS
jgi:hypothetical protein